MHTITGGIEFKNGIVPEKWLKYLRESGFKLPFVGKFNCTNKAKMEEVKEFFPKDTVLSTKDLVIEKPLPEPKEEPKEIPIDDGTPSKEEPILEDIIQ